MTWLVLTKGGSTTVLCHPIAVFISVGPGSVQRHPQKIDHSYLHQYHYQPLSRIFAYRATVYLRPTNEDTYEWPHSSFSSLQLHYKVGEPDSAILCIPPRRIHLRASVLVSFSQMISFSWLRERWIHTMGRKDLSVVQNDGLSYGPITKRCWPRRERFHICLVSTSTSIIKEHNSVRLEGQPSHVLFSTLIKYANLYSSSSHMLAWP